MLFRSEKHGGKITAEENEGKKRLAYPIKKQDYAVYCFYNLQLPADAPKKIESVLNITDEIIRYLLVSVDPRKVKYEEKQAARKRWIQIYTILPGKAAFPLENRERI